MKLCIFTILFSVILCAFSETPAPKPVYPYGAPEALKIGADLYEALPGKFQVKISPHPIAVLPNPVPLIIPMPAGPNHPTTQVAITSGFINLINHLSHAKAIDHIQPGYFDKYVMNLMRANGEEFTMNPPDMTEPHFWTDDVMNDQMSYFNQMMGIVTAINLSHHYLGHCMKYSGQMTKGKNPVPINSLLSPSEWEVSVKAGALNSLDTANATEGARILFEAVGKLPRRPTWTAFVIPPTVDVSKLNKKLSTYETDFFHGQLK